MLQGYLENKAIGSFGQGSLGIGSLGIGSLGYGTIQNDTSIVFHAATYDPDTYEMQLQAVGEGVPTSTHTADIYAPDFEGVYRVFGEDEPVWEGSRGVENTPTGFPANSPNDLSDNAVADCTAAYISGSEETEVTITGNDAWISLTETADHTGVLGQSRIISMKVKGVGDSIGKIVLLLDTKTDDEYVSENITLTAEYQRISLAVGPYTRTHRYDYLSLNRSAYHDSNVPIGATMLVKGLQFEIVTTHTNKTIPSELIEEFNVPKFFANANGNTVTDNVVTEAVGTALAEQPWLKYQPAATNSCLYSRDLTNAAWNKSNTPTVTYDQIGLTGEPNTATFIEDISILQARSVTQTVVATFGTNTHTVVAYIKKDSDETRFPEVKFDFSAGGVRQYNMVQINTKTGELGVRTSLGTTDQESISNGDWWRVLISVVASNNTGVSISVFPANAETLGGASDNSAAGSIIVGNVELHLGKTLPEVRDLGPIFTTTDAVTTDETIITHDAANHDDTSGAYYLDVDYTGADKDVLTVDGNLLSIGEGAVGDELVTTDPITAANWIPSGNNTVTDEPDGSVKITYVDNSYGARLNVTAAGILSNDLVQGTSCEVTCKIKAVGSCVFRWKGSGGFANAGPESVWKTVSFITNVMGTVGNHYLDCANMSATEIMYVKDISVKQPITDVLKLTDGLDYVQTAITEGTHKVGISYGDSKMDLNLNGVWAGEVAYDGSFGTGDIIQGEVAKEIQRIEVTSYAQGKAWVGKKMGGA